jgi:hypothetical protein
MIIWAVVLVLLNIIDVVTTRIGLSLGATELNPFIDTVIDSWIVWPIKIIVPAIFGLLIIKSGRFDYLLYGMVIIYSFLIVWNLGNLAAYYVS